MGSAATRANSPRNGTASPACWGLSGPSEAHAGSLNLGPCRLNARMIAQAALARLTTAKRVLPGLSASIRQ